MKSKDDKSILFDTLLNTTEDNIIHDIMIIKGIIMDMVLCIFFRRVYVSTEEDILNFLEMVSNIAGDLF